MSWPKTGATYYHAQIGLPDIICATNAMGWFSAIVRDVSVLVLSTWIYYDYLLFGK